jgi:hypothetical protein
VKGVETLRDNIRQERKRLLTLVGSGRLDLSTPRAQAIAHDLQTYLSWALEKANDLIEFEVLRKEVLHEHERGRDSCTGSSRAKARNTANREG